MTNPCANKIPETLGSNEELHKTDSEQKNHTTLLTIVRELTGLSPSNFIFARDTTCIDQIMN